MHIHKVVKRLISSHNLFHEKSFRAGRIPPSPKPPHVLFFPVLVLSMTAQSPLSNSKDADFAELSRYRAADSQLIQAAQQARVVFLGDFDHGLLGISVRRLVFRMEAGSTAASEDRQPHSSCSGNVRDVLDLHPQAVVLEGSSNDMRLGFSPRGDPRQSLDNGRVGGCQPYSRINCGDDSSLRLCSPVDGFENGRSDSGAESIACETLPAEALDAPSLQPAVSRF